MTKRTDVEKLRREVKELREKGFEEAAKMKEAEAQDLHFPEPPDEYFR